MARPRSQDGAQKNVLEPEGAIAIEGWLLLKHWRADTWDSAYCMLREDGMLSFEGARQQGCTHLGTCRRASISKFTEFEDPNDPEAAARLQKERPFGFVLDVGQVFHFDAERFNNQRLWMRALGRISPKVQPPMQQPPTQPLHRGLVDAPCHGSGPTDPGAPFEWLRVTRTPLKISAFPDAQALLVGDTIEVDHIIQTRVENVLDVNGARWVELSPFEAWRRKVCAPSRAFVPIDDMVQVNGNKGPGANLLPISRERWPPRDLAERAGVPWAVGDHSALRPPFEHSSVNCLGHWDPGPPCPESNGSGGKRIVAGGRIGVCVVIFGGIPAKIVWDWLLYHLHIGVERIYVFVEFDSQIVPLVQQMAEETMSQQTIRLHKLSEDWWQYAEKNSRFFKNRKQPWAQSVVHKYENSFDIGVRQQICIDLALQDAKIEKLDWFMHLDIRELLYFSLPEFRENAPAFFAAVDYEVELLTLLTHECVPQTMDSDSWFEDITLFKLAKPFLRSKSDVPQTVGKQSDPSDLSYGSKTAFVKDWRRNFAGALHISEVSTHMLWQEGDGTHAVRLRYALLHSKARQGEGKLKTDSDHCCNTPIPDGTRSFAQLVENEKVELKNLVLDSSAAPVILSYSYASFWSWVHHYEFLASTQPSPLADDVCDRPAHFASLNLVERQDLNTMQEFYDVFVLGNAIGELPYLCRSGFALRVDGVRQLLKCARKARSERTSEDTTKPGQQPRIVAAAGVSAREASNQVRQQAYWLEGEVVTSRTKAPATAQASGQTAPVAPPAHQQSRPLRRGNTADTRIAAAAADLCAGTFQGVASKGRKQLQTSGTKERFRT